MAAKTIYWTGATDSVFITAGNWNDNVGVVSGLDPVPTDTCVVPVDASVNITGFNHQDVDFGEAGTHALVVEKGSSVTIGSSTVPLIIGTTAGALLDLRGSGSTHLKIAGSESAGSIYVGGSPNLHLASYASEETTDNLYIDITSGSVYLAWDASDHAEVDNIYISGSGTVYIGESVTSTAAAAITKLCVSGCTVYCRSAVATVTNNGGTIYQEKGTITTLNNLSGDSYYNAVAGTLTTGNVYGGALSLAENPGGIGTVTATTINIYGSASFLDPIGVAALGADFNCYGRPHIDGVVDFGANRQITTVAIGT